MGRGIELVAAAALTAVALWAGQARAEDQPLQQAGTAPALHIELNRVASGDADGCRLTFVVRNATGADLPEPRFEFVLFDKDGLVDRLTTFDFGALVTDKTSVRQFDLPGASCDRLGRILVNGPARCGDGSAPHCKAELSLASRTDIPLNR